MQSSVLAPDRRFREVFAFYLDSRRSSTKITRDDNSTSSHTIVEPQPFQAKQTSNHEHGNIHLRWHAAVRAALGLPICRFCSGPAACHFVPLNDSLDAGNPLMTKSEALAMQRPSPAGGCRLTGLEGCGGQWVSMHGLHALYTCSSVIFSFSPIAIRASTTITD